MAASSETAIVGPVQEGEICSYASTADSIPVRPKAAEIFGCHPIAIGVGKKAGKFGRAAKYSLNVRSADALAILESSRRSRQGLERLPGGQAKLEHPPARLVDSLLGK